MRHIKQLDSIRALAVILVIISHWFPINSWINKYPNGPLGVNTFFVLSGFLITRILLDNKKTIELNAGKKLLAIKNFVIRRMLRIFPIYYLLIIILLIIGAKTGTSIRENSGWFFTYTSNFYFFIRQGWDGMSSHLWSLAIEEQFYLIWPWLIIFIPKKHLSKLIFAAVFIGISSNYFLRLFAPQNEFLIVLTPTCFDAFGLGGALAYINIYRPEYQKIADKFINYLALGSFFLLTLKYIGGIAIDFPDRTLISFMALFLINFCLVERKNLLYKHVFGNNVLSYLGKISYGIYLLHHLAAFGWTNFITFLDDNHVKIPLINSFIPDSLSSATLLVQKFLFLVLISSISWKVLENPINNLKKHFK